MASRVSTSRQPDDLGAAADPVGRLGVHALSSGDVTVRIGGVRDAAHLDALIGAMRCIRGVGGVRLRATQPVHSPVVVLNATRPIALAGELRTALGRQVTSCVFVDGDIELELDGTAPDPAPRRPRRTDRRTAPGDGEAGGPRPRPRAARHRPPPGLGVRPGPGAETAGVGAGADDDAPDADAVLRRTVDEVDSLSVMTFDGDLRFRAVAGALHERDRHTAAEIVGRRPSELLDAETWRVLRPGYEGALAGSTTTLETPSPDGRRRYRATFRPVRSGARVVAGSVAFVDVTDAYREGRRLEELRDVFASCFDGAPSGQALISPEARWLRVNPALERELHLDAAVLVDRSFADVVLPRDRERVTASLRALAAGDPEELRLDVPIVRGDGEVLDVRVGLMPIRTHEGTLRGFFAHVTPAAGRTAAAAD